MSRPRRKHTSSASNLKTYLRIVRYLKRYKFAVFWCILLSVLISLLHFASLGMTKPLGDLLFGDSYTVVEQGLNKLGPTGTAIANFLKEYVLYDKYRTLYLLMVVTLVMVVVKNLLRFFQEYLAGYLSARSAVDISNDLFGKVTQLPIGFFSKEGTNQISAHFVNDIGVMAQGSKNFLMKAFREPLKAVASVVLALVINWKLTLLALGIFPLAMACIKSLGKRVKRGAKKTLLQQGNILSLVEEAFQGIKVVQAYRMEKYLQTKFTAQNLKLMQYRMKVTAVDAATNPIMEILVTAAGIFLLIFSAKLVLQGTMTTGDFCAFYAALGALFDPVRKLADFNNRMNEAVAGGERVFALLDREPEIRDVPNAIVLPPIGRDIRFEGVWFAYEPGKPVLRDISFTVQAGECIALVGRSGSGKSTLVSLLLRFYDVDKGGIFLDGHNIKDVTLASLRQQIGLVTQEPFLFHDTIGANIACHSDGISKAALEKAAQAAYAHQFIEGLTHQYDTMYGEGGIDLSGGQKHRVAIARSILKSPHILILDEPMANLDAESEFFIKEALEKFVVGRTTFIIAHRFSTIEKANRILVLNEGGLEAFGTQEELLKNSPTYQNLYHRQAIGFQDHSISE